MDHFGPPMAQFFWPLNERKTGSISNFLISLFPAEKSGKQAVKREKSGQSLNLEQFSSRSQSEVHLWSDLAEILAAARRLIVLQFERSDFSLKHCSFRIYCMNSTPFLGDISQLFSLF